MRRARRDIVKFGKPDPKHLLQSFIFDLRLLVTSNIFADVGNLKGRLVNIGELAAEDTPEREALRRRGGEFCPGGVWMLC